MTQTGIQRKDEAGNPIEIKSVLGLLKSPFVFAEDQETMIQNHGEYELLQGMNEALANVPEVVDPGLRFQFVYQEVFLDDNEKPTPLHIRLGYQKGVLDYKPLWEEERVVSMSLGKGKPPIQVVKWFPLSGVPYLYHKQRYFKVSAKEGVIQLNSSEDPIQVMDEFEGLTDDKRMVKVIISPDADHKFICTTGFHVSPEGMNRWREVNKALVAKNSKKKAIYCTDSKGWVRFEGCQFPHYVYADQVIAPPGVQSYDLKSTSSASAGVQVKGSYASWKAIIQQVVKNPAMATLMGFSASSALLGLIPEMESGLIHLVGGSGCGKSTALKVAASMIGSADGPKEPTAYIHSWNATSNGMESPLQAKSDAPSFYDESFEMPKTIDVMALLYWIINGRGKARMTKNIEAAQVKTWKTQIISTGEGSFSSRMAENGQDSMPGGLQFRVVEVHVNQMPFWNHVQEQSTLTHYGDYGSIVNQYKAKAPTAAATIIESIEKGLKANHGHFWKHWIQRLQSTDGLQWARQTYGQERESLNAHITSKSSDIYIRRAKHIAAALTGLQGILNELGMSEAENSQVLAQAKQWAVEHLWSSSIDSTEKESDSIYNRFYEHIMSNETAFFHEIRNPYFDKSCGWIEKGTGHLSLTDKGMKTIAAKLKMDVGRLRAALLARGSKEWDKARVRVPNAGNAGTNNPITVYVGFNIYKD